MFDIGFIIFNMLSFLYIVYLFFRYFRKSKDNRNSTTLEIMYGIEYDEIVDKCLEMNYDEFVLNNQNNVVKWVTPSDLENSRKKLIDSCSEFLNKKMDDLTNSDKL